MRLIFIGFLAILGLALAACQKTQITELKPSKLAADKNSTHGDVETFDFNGDSRIDGWIYYGLEEGKRVVVKRRTDLNFDGKVDVTQFFRGQLPTLEEIDLDFDNRIDLRTYYENGIVIKTEMDLGFDGQADLWRFYTDGALVRKERDTNRDGQVDTWEYFEKGALARVGKDIDGDGKVDVWE